MKIYHYSNEKIDKVEVKYFGDNNFTLNDKKASSLKRSFFYYDINNIEARFNNCKLHYTDIKEAYIYDLNIDKFGYKKDFRNFDILLSDIKNAGYKGILYNIGYLKIVNLFYDIEVKSC